MRTFISLVLVLSFSPLWAQPMPCASRQMLEISQQRHPELIRQMEETEGRLQDWISRQEYRRNKGEVITIPVVVHVIWNQAGQNISDEQILSQLDILNADFRKHNADSLLSDHPFWPFTADVGIEFCLAVTDPLGNPVSGITRTQTSVTNWDWSNYEEITSTASGGQDNWDPTRYLNLYSANLDGFALGFATFPDEFVMNPEKDGVVVHFQAFGNTGMAGTGDYEANGQGRTATHEVGHWLNLNHIWGDTSCGDDLVADTPVHEDPFGNYDCPSFPLNAMNQCGSDENGEMFMNYMDYTNDTCMSMFTNGQAMRVLATLNDTRASLLESFACEDPTGILPVSAHADLHIYPNPSSGWISVQLTTASPDLVWQGEIRPSAGGAGKDLGAFPTGQTSVDLRDLPAGAYILRFQSKDQLILRKVILHP